MRTSNASTRRTTKVKWVVVAEDSSTSVLVQLVHLIHEPKEWHREEWWVVGIIHEIAIAVSINLVQEVIFGMWETMGVDGFTYFYSEISCDCWILLTK